MDVVDFFEDLGTMLRRKQMSIDAVWNAFGDYAIYYWEIIGYDFKKMQQKRLPGQVYYAEFDNLVAELKAEDKRRGLPPIIVAPEDRTDFLRGEAALAVDATS